MKSRKEIEKRGWRRSVIKTLKLDSKKIHHSTGVEIVYINHWMADKPIPDYVEMTLDNFFDEIRVNLDRLRTKLNLFTHK